MSAGYQNVVGWAFKRLLAEAKSRTKALGQEVCKNVDSVYYKLKSAGAAVPSQTKWNNLSCDQKIAFVTALGPYGAAMAAGGALLGGWATDASKEMKKYASTAAAKIGDTGGDWVKSAAGSASNFVSHGGGLWGTSTPGFGSPQGVSLGATRSYGPTLRADVQGDMPPASRSAWMLPAVGLLALGGALFYFNRRRR